jgi:cytochrome P450
VTDNSLLQARWYEASDAPGNYSIFTDPNIQRHAHDRRMVANGFSMTALLEMEDFVSECVKVLELRLGEFADNRQPIDMAHWLQCYAFDVIGEVTVSSFLRSSCSDD